MSADAPRDLRCKRARRAIRSRAMRFRASVARTEARMSAGRVGFFGKLPSHGDFIRRGVSENFVNVWDSWLQECMVESRRALDARWLNVYLTSPIWRFVLCDGVIGAASYAGILLPSVDKVGRYF